uniref:Ig-like domain-containing protein n=1 Tax=uncultured Limnohabitans sp. TaxID=768543 RepID=UPI00260C1BDD
HNLNAANASLANGDFITQDRTHEYAGKVSSFTGNGASVELTLTQGNTVIEKTYVTPDDNGNWTWDRTSQAELADGLYSLQAKLLDKAGNLISSIHHPNRNLAMKNEILALNGGYFDSDNT